MKRFHKGIFSIARRRADRTVDKDFHLCENAMLPIWGPAMRNRRLEAGHDITRLACAGARAGISHLGPGTSAGHAPSCAWASAVTPKFAAIAATLVRQTHHVHAHASNSIFLDLELPHPLHILVRWHLPPTPSRVPRPLH
jgi:hypothetical protein